MSRYIDADALMDNAVIHWSATTNESCIPVDAVDNAPTIDAEPVRHGKWIEYPDCLAYSGAYDSDWIVCSECGKPFNLIDNCTEEFNYCPNCGARMDE